MDAALIDHEKRLTRIETEHELRVGPVLETLARRIAAAEEQAKQRQTDYEQLERRTVLLEQQLKDRPAPPREV